MQRKRDDLARHGSTWEKPMLQLDGFLENVKGILYFNTPFLGTKLADRTKYTHSRGAMLEHLDVLNTQACHLNEWFRDWRSRRSIQARAIFANGVTKLPLGELVELVETGACGGRRSITSWQLEM
ncbi:unnamed protein product [Calypogeia fissa]